MVTLLMNNKWLNSVLKLWLPLMWLPQQVTLNDSRNSLIHS